MRCGVDNNNIIIFESQPVVIGMVKALIEYCQKWPIPGLFFFFSSFQYRWQLTMFNKNLADDGIRTADRFANCLWLLFDLVFRKLDT